MLSGAARTDDRPNIVWISCEDISPHLGCYGYPQATTPNLDALAEQGVRYSRAFTVTGVCATNRASIITGMYASTNGNQFMRCTVDLDSSIRLFPTYLREAGYYCTNNSKTDYNVSGNHGRCWDESNSKAHFRNRRNKEQPFFSVFNFTNTHESKIFNYRRPKNLTDDEIHHPDKMQVPPYYPDTEITRTDWAHYYDNISSMDKLVAEILQQIEEDGLADDTIVMFWSDHGVGLPRAKRWIYESGTHVPLIVRIPEKHRVDGQGLPGTVNDQLVSILDLTPSVLNLAGIDIPDHMQGQAFLGPKAAPPREFIYTIRDRMDERYDMIRAVRGKRYKYIRNYMPYKPWFQILNYMEQEHTMKELRRLYAAGELHTEAAQFMADHKPIEEFYDLANDPYEINNLIKKVDDHPELAAELELLRRKHQDWIFETLDTGLIPEAELGVRETAAGSRYRILRQSNGPQLLERLLLVNRIACEANDVAAMLRHFEDPDAAVRFWAVTGLANAAPLGSPAALATIKRGLVDVSPSVQVAAARAAWRIGRPELALPVLAENARSEQEFLSLAAMHVIDEMDNEAASLRDTVRWVKSNGKKYPVRVADYLLRSANDQARRLPDLLDGHCPVTLAMQELWVKGDEQFTTTFEGASYTFAGRKEHLQFLKQPTQYAPRFGGADVVEFRRHRKRFLGTREHGVIYRGSVYLFHSEENLEAFWDSPEEHVRFVAQLQSL